MTRVSASSVTKYTRPHVMILGHFSKNYQKVHKHFCFQHYYPEGEHQ